MSGVLRGSIVRSLQTLLDAGPVAGLNDGQLIERFLDRRTPEAAEAAFAALVTLHGPMVWGVCRSALTDLHDAEDAFQATFLVLVRKGASVKRRDTLGPWLYGVARRVALGARAVASRRRRREGTEVDEIAVVSTTDPISREEVDLLHREIDRLPEKYRAVVVLCHLEGRTQAEAARLLGCPIGTIGVRVVRAREILRDRLTRRGLALPAALAGAGVSSVPSTTSAAAVPAALATSTVKAAMGVAAGKSLAAGGVSVAVLHLAQGACKTMTLTKVTIAASCLLAAGLVSSGIGWVAMGDRPAELQKAAQAQLPSDDPAARTKSNKNLKRIGLALYNYAGDHNGRLPASAIWKDGKPLLSWRVAILPYLEVPKTPYDKFRLDEPWDSPHNKALLKEMPEVYAPVVDKVVPKDSTCYQVFEGSGALFDGKEGTRLSDVADGTSLTVMFVEGATTVPWTKPEDLSFDADKPLPEVGGQFTEGFQAAMANGSVLFLKKDIDPKTLRALITRAGGEAIPPEVFEQPPAKAALAPTKQQITQARLKVMNNMRLIGLALDQYAESHGNRYPSAAAFRRDGKPILSWRVAILPYLGEEAEALFKKFKLDEPWDGPHNNTLLQEMPIIFAPVIPTNAPKGSTYLQGIVGSGSVFGSDFGARIPDVRGKELTLMVVEAATFVPWTKPEDLEFEIGKPSPKLGGQFEKGFLALFPAQKVRFLSRELDPELLGHLIRYDDNRSFRVDGLNSPDPADPKEFGLQ